ncbi:MAG TPA: nucleotidyltransferase domain-containing protein [Candidatus Nanoarchaeia archaeon]|nr:nucleotidyltransferase domain-containing protein [Candidatus Nanoarchaeia archaeon]
MKLEKKPDKPIDVQKIIRQTIDLILKEDTQNNVKAILLFGSHADGTAMWRSDIDICAVFKREITLTEATKFRIHILGRVDDVVDLQVFHTLPVKVRNAIVENHKILFNSPDFDEFSFMKRTKTSFFEWKNKKVMLEA